MDNLRKAVEMLKESQRASREGKRDSEISALRAAIWRVCDHLEAQQAETQSEQPSSQATETPAETSDTLTISSPWSSRVRANGTLELLVPQATWALCSSILIRGNEQGEEIGVTPTFREETPLSGSPSPSTGEPHPSASGAPGTDVAGIPPQTGREQLRSYLPVTAPTPEPTQDAQPVSLLNNARRRERLAQRVRVSLLSSNEEYAARIEQAIRAIYTTRPSDEQ